MNYVTNDGVAVKIGDYVSDNSIGETYVVTALTENAAYMDELIWNDDTDTYDKNGDYRALTPAEFKHKIAFN